MAEDDWGGWGGGALGVGGGGGGGGEGGIGEYRRRTLCRKGSTVAGVYSYFVAAGVEKVWRWAAALSREYLTRL